MFVAEKFISGCNRIMVNIQFLQMEGPGIHRACRFLKMNHHLHSSYEKSIIERTMQYIKDRTTESFDDYFPCKRKEM